MKIAVIGAGPIGSILTAYLSKIKKQVILVDILKDRLELIKKLGITLSGVGNFQAPVHSVCFAVNDLKKKYNIKDISHIFICVKAPFLPSVLKEVKALKTKSTVVVFMNGMDLELTAADVLGKDNVLRGVINYAGSIITGTEVRMSFFNSPNYIGALNAAGAIKAKETAKLLSESGLTTSFTENIHKHTWEKAILNGALAPVCAITGLTMKAAMDNPETYHLVEELLKEGIAAAKANGHDYGSKFFGECIKYLKNAGAHKPSMLVDLERKQTTEIDYINGKIVEYGRAKKVAVPYNDSITCLVRARENA
ncbi:MAG: 2-dehydropantoate 2-reductase [Candidatus Brocadiia bacterium]